MTTTLNGMMRVAAGALMVMAGAQVFAADTAANANTRKGQIIERGRYLVKIGGCNDCHTVGYGESNGAVPESQWLMGSPVGWKGPWGTTYAANLRTYFGKMSENDWVKTAHTITTRPPMPWFTLHQITDRDLRAMYLFITTLGPGGNAVPDYAPPGKDVAGPVITFPGPPPGK